jgi:hypothetical protein
MTPPKPHENHRMSKLLPTHRALAAWAAPLLLLAGCQDFSFKMPAKPPPPEPKPPPVAAITLDPVLAGSIGAVTYLAEVEPLPVRGFGIVIGLGKNGSADCPTFVRDHLIDRMSKEREAWADPESRKKFSPAELMDSPATAVVEILGLVPPGAARGATFDIMVRTIPGTATRSLAGGLLLPTDLHLSDPSGSNDALFSAEPVARAAGPIFVNPFATSEDQEAEGLRTGYVLSGGQSTEERTFRLLLREPSYPMARRVSLRINERFGQRPPVADATSRGYLTIKMPPEYASHRADFLRLLPHVYVDGTAPFSEAKLRELVQYAVRPGYDLEAISLAWEGIGPTAIPQLKTLYRHADPRVRFYAARAGLRLKDPDAVVVLTGLSNGSDRDIALLSVKELGRCNLPYAAASLRPLLNADDQELRVAAYEALLNYSSTFIQTRRFPHLLDPMQLNLALDVVESTGRPLIYVRRTGMPRIAVFGRDMPITLPLFYAEPDDSVTLNAIGETGDLTVLTKRYNQTWDPLYVPPRVIDLIAALADLPTKNDVGVARGIGLPYSQVVQVLAALSQDQTIPAPVEVERVSLAELFGPAPETERSESEPAAESAPSEPAQPAAPPAGGRAESDSGPMPSATP